MESLDHAFTINVVPDRDDSIARLSQSSAERLGIQRGDTIELRKRRRLLGLIVLIQARAASTVQISPLAARNLRARDGDQVTLRLIPDLKYAKRVAIVPVADTVVGYTGNLFDDFLAPYFREAYRPLGTGDVFACTSKGRRVEFYCVQSDPGPIDIVGSDTIIHGEGDPVERAKVEGWHDDKNWDAMFEDMGGCEDQIKQARKWIVSPLQNPSAFKSFGDAVPTKILVTGPRGTGKSLFLRSLFNEVNLDAAVFFFIVDSPVTPFQLRKAHSECSAKQPSLLCLDSLDVITSPPAQEQDSKTDEGDTLSALIELLQPSKSSLGMKVVATTHDPTALDARLRALFDRRITMSVPDAAARTKILQTRTQTMALAGDVDLAAIAQRTAGYVGADLNKLCLEATMESHQRRMDGGAAASIAGAEVTMGDFDAALSSVPPSTEPAPVPSVAESSPPAYSQEGAAASTTDASTLASSYDVLPRPSEQSAGPSSTVVSQATGSSAAASTQPEAAATTKGFKRLFKRK